ncbi:MAG: nuclear transport factor 2 family protein [Planctomycetes bacterium]|nr:nuclear transport factor 2 family protein [Planctomycetota bacterium]
MKKYVLVVCLGLLMMSLNTPRFSVDQREQVDRILTDFHDAAAKGDFDRYFGHFTDDAIFFGTDPAERWTVDEFKGYAREPFADGHGWTYHMRERNIFLAPGNNAAWFDEIVESEHYGKCRGTGALILDDGRWKLTQYNLVIPVPNDFADEVVAATRGGLVTPRTIVIVRHAEKLAGRDPGLSDVGRARVLRWQILMEEFEFGIVCSSDYRRTRETAEPFAADAGVDLTLYDPGEPGTFVEQLKANNTEGAALVVGHSNTVPELLRAFGLEDIADMSDREYYHLFIVRLDELGRASLTHLHF